MISPKQLGKVELISDMATGGTLAVARIEQYRAVQIAQSTAGQVLTLPNPVDTGVRFGLDVANTGTVSFEMGSRTIGAGSVMRFYWNGSAWVTNAPPAAGGASGFKGIAPTFAAARAIPGLVAGDYVWITSDGDPDVLPAQRRGAFRKVFGPSPTLSTSWSGPYGWVSNSPQMFSSDQMFTSTQMYVTA